MIWALLLWLLSASPASADIYCPAVHSGRDPAGFQALTVSTSAVGLTVPTGASFGIVTVETNTVRYRDDGTAPTSSVGVLATGPTSLLICGSSLARVQFIRQGSSDAALTILYYR